MEFIREQARADEVLMRAYESKQTRAFYLDLEADNFHHYNEILCTVQMCVNGNFYLFDAINLDLSGTFCDILRERMVWLHGCDYDLYLLNRFLGVRPLKLHDTQIAARLSGFRKFGYAPLVDQICGQVLPKDSQRADWTKRPLPQRMIDYAENDVRYLPQISDLLLLRLEKLKRVEWFEESCAALVRSVSPYKQVDTEDQWRVPSSGNLSPSELRYLKALYFWRDEQAQALDRPTFKVLNNQQLIKLSKELGENPDVTLPRFIKDKRRESLLAVIAQATDQLEESWPQKLPRVRHKKIKVDDEALSAIMAKRDMAAKKLNLDNSLIASRKVLEAIVRDPKSAENLLNWQRAILEL